MAEGSLALVGATLVDATGAPAVPNATVVVENGRIVAAGPSASTPVPPGARRIDVAGKTIVPGLWDNHAHLHQIEWIPTYIAAGVTSVRDMGSEWPLLVAMRSAIRSGKVTRSESVLRGTDRRTRTTRVWRIQRLDAGRRARDRAPLPPARASR